MQRHDPEYEWILAITVGVVAFICGVAVVVLRVIGHAFVTLYRDHGKHPALKWGRRTWILSIPLGILFSAGWLVVLSTIMFLASALLVEAT